MSQDLNGQLNAKAEEAGTKRPIEDSVVEMGGSPSGGTKRKKFDQKPIGQEG